MKRFGAKAVGLGLALFAAEPRLLADDWQVAGGNAPTPRMLPAEIRPGDWGPAGSTAPPTVWLPSRPTITRIPAASDSKPETPPVLPPITPVSMPAVTPPITPLRNRVVEAPVPAASAPTPLLPLPSPTQEWRPVGSEPPQPIRQEPSKNDLPKLDLPKIVDDPQPVPPPRRLPEPNRVDIPQKLDPPRVVATVQDELPTAPVELMVPPGVVLNKHKSFGSEPIRLSRDYPTLHDLFECLHPGGGRLTDPAGSPVEDRWQFQGEFLLWNLNGSPIPVLATTTLAPGATPNEATGNGFLGDPSTRTLLGPGSYGSGVRPGFRFRAGWWQDDCTPCGLDASIFYLGNKKTSTLFSSPGLPVLTRPFFSPNTSTTSGAIVGETGEIVAFPNFASGNLSIQSTSSVWGADANIRKAFCRTCDYQSYGFVGYRFLSLNETLTIGEAITALPGNTTDPAGTFTTVQDSFAAQNWFHGGQAGAAMERNWGRVSLDLRASIALGATHQQLDINGFQTKLLPGATTPQTFQGGLLAVGPNLGRFTQDKFSVVPEGSGNIGFWLTPAIKLYTGYNVIYWSNVIRPGNQIDRVIDVKFVPNPPPGFVPSNVNRPLPLFGQSDVWIRGVQFGVELRW